MSSYNKEIKIMNPQLVSNSGDTMRNAIGKSIGGSTDKFLSRTTPFKKTDASSEPEELINKYTYFYRIFGDVNQFVNDKQWKNYVIGGEFLDTNFSGIYSETAFSDHYHREEIPYSLLETKANGTFDESPKLYFCTTSNK